MFLGPEMSPPHPCQCSPVHADVGKKVNHHPRKTQLYRCRAAEREMESFRTGERRIREALNSAICTRGCVCVQILWAKHQSRKSIRPKDPAGLSSLHRRGGVTLATITEASSLPSPLLPQLDLSSSRAKEAPTSLSVHLVPVEGRDPRVQNANRRCVQVGPEDGERPGRSAIRWKPEGRTGRSHHFRIHRHTNNKE